MSLREEAELAVCTQMQICVEHDCGWRERGGHYIDAFLDVLTEHAVEWAHTQTEQDYTYTDPGMLRRALAVLREDAS